METSVQTTNHGWYGCMHTHMHMHAHGCVYACMHICAPQTAARPWSRQGAAAIPYVPQSSRASRVGSAPAAASALCPGTNVCLKLYAFVLCALRWLTAHSHMLLNTWKESGLLCADSSSATMRGSISAHPSRTSRSAVADALAPSSTSERNASCWMSNGVAAER